MDKASSNDEVAATDDKRTNVLILSSASGKPIFARYGTDEQVGQMCGVLQGLRAVVVYDDTDLGLGDIHSLENGSSNGTMRVVWWHVKGLLFCAIAHRAGTTQAHLQFVLETLYCQLALNLTQPVLDSILMYPNFDVENILGSTTERQLHAILDQLLDLYDQCDDDNDDDEQDAASSHFSSQLSLVHALGSGALQPLHPLSSAVRDQASRALQEVGDDTPDTLFAFLYVQPPLSHDKNNNHIHPRPSNNNTTSRLVSWVQSGVRGLQLRSADASLLLFFLAQQSASLLASESLWLPVCLPHFNATGYVYCYVKCLHVDTGLCLGLTSHLGTTEQFASFQQAATTLCTKLRIPIILQQSSTTTTATAAAAAAAATATAAAAAAAAATAAAQNSKNVEGTSAATPTNETTQQQQQQPKVVEEDENDGVTSEEDYVDASGDGDRMIPYVAAKGLVEEVALALDETLVSKQHAQYLEIGQAVHFLFRYDVSLPRVRHETPGRLPQCLCVGHDQHFGTAASRSALWSTYDKLMMRLRLGSAQSESIQDALSMIAQNRQANYGQESPPVHVAVDHACHASTLLEAPPDFAGMTSECQGEYRHVGINGDAFELYFTVSSELSVKQATALGAKLVRRLLMDQQKLFLWNPMVWQK